MIDVEKMIEAITEACSLVSRNRHMPVHKTVLERSEDWWRVSNDIVGSVRNEELKSALHEMLKIVLKELRIDIENTTKKLETMTSSSNKLSAAFDAALEEHDGDV